jgi:hypothetical protein
MSGKTIPEFTEITTVAPGDKMVGVDVSDTTASSGGTNKHFTKANLLKEYATLVGEEALTNKTLTTPVIPSFYQDAAKTKLMTTPNTASDTLATLAATQTFTNKTLSTGSVVDANVTVTEVLKKVYPVGAIYSSTVSTNPNTLFGFGTWVAYGEGRVLVGKASSGTFETAGGTGGAETVTLTAAQSGLPAHNHSLVLYADGSGTTKPSVSSSSAVDNATTEDNSAANASQAHTNLQPYVIVYFFHRTE